MVLNNIHHVAIICSNYEKSKEFYTKILGLEVIREVYRKERDSYKLDLKLGKNQIELFSFPNSPKRLSYPEACGLRHLAFQVDNVEKVVKELIDKGIEVEPIRVDEFTEKTFTFFSDPDGLPLEIYE
ncbi:VOC family protein [Clostridium sp. SHJSY1]|uniref:SMU1112c/YaeR family gloxylase I-like metalloprotein n=1 Tax=Clostridium sp. SHJSY1 TaxID=2942483 RepID=UPI0028740710|nr:VOC family protein [Clostridium sp. SHJSY1]MDS0526431.1 VOC family protein [Clostridium sp. SHJSY1]